MPQEINTDVYLGIQRVFRNAVVRFLRDRLQKAHGANHAAKLREPFRLEEWQAIAQAARSSRSVGAMDTSPIDDFDLLGVNHFFNVFDKFWSDLRPDHEVVPDPEPKIRQSVLGWLREIKNMRDPLSHPGEQDLSREDAFHVLDCARRVLKTIGLSESAEQIKVIEQRIFGADPNVRPDPLEARLPSRDAIVVDFVGRSGELDALMEWAEDPIARRWALAGDGGKGKSALAFAFAARVVVAAPAPLQTVIWLSAKRRQFVEGKTRSIDLPDFSNLDDAINAILNHFGWAEDLGLPIESRRAKSLDLLNAFPSLLILDDIDSLEAENEDVIEFFTLNVPATSSKVLLTSRRTLFGMGATTTHISGLGLPDGEAFIQSRCQLMGLDPALFGRSAIKEILKVSDGSPLYIEDIMRLSSSVRSIGEALKVWTGRSGAEARRYALGRECDLLTPESRKLLMAACVTAGPVSFVELEAISGLPVETVTASLQELQKLFLVPKPRLIEGEQRFDLNLNTKTLVREVYGNSSSYSALEAAYRAISGGINLEGSGRKAGLVRQATLLMRNGRPGEAEALLNKALEIYPNDPRLVGALAWLYKAWEPVRLTDARERFKRAFQLKNLNEETYEHWARMEWRESEWIKCAEAAESGIKLLPTSRTLLYWAGRARARAARDLAGGLHDEKASAEAVTARERLERALRIPDPSARVSDSEVLRALILVCETQADTGGLRRYFRRWNRNGSEDPLFLSEWERLSRKFKLGTLQELVGESD